MCVVSMIMEHSYVLPDQPIPPIIVSPYVPIPYTGGGIPQADIDEFYELLRRAREYDKKNNEPDCELESKKNNLREIAEKLGVNIRFDDE